MYRRPSRGFPVASLAATATLLFVAAPRVANAQSGTEAAPADPAAVQLAVEKGLFFVEQQSMRWWKTKKCATCHEGEILLVAANLAKSRGVPVDQEKLDFWTERWVLVDGVTQYTDGRTVGLGMLTAPLVFMHRDLSRDESAPRAEKWAEILRQSFKVQDADGLWDPKGAIDVTPRMALALADLEASKMPLPTDLRGEMTLRRNRTEKWIKSHDPQRPDKTESLAAWVVYEHQRGEPARAKQLLDELFGRRNEDGGWGIKRGDATHSLVTAVVLLALKTSGLPNEHPVVSSTQRYLLDKQKEDGRWRELGRHFHPDQYHIQYDVWTTGYAVAALSLTLSQLPADTKRLFMPDPAIVAEVDELTRSAAEGYLGQVDRSGDPTRLPTPAGP